MAVKRESENFTGYTLHWVSSHHSYEAFLAVALLTATPHPPPIRHSLERTSRRHRKERTYDVRTAGRRRRRRVRKTLLLDYYTHATRAAIHTCDIHTYGARVRASMGCDNQAPRKHLVPVLLLIGAATVRRRSASSSAASFPPTTTHSDSRAATHDTKK